MPSDQNDAGPTAGNEPALGADQPSWNFKLRDGGKNLKARSVRSGAVTIASQGAQFGLRTISTVVLARLLTPADFGIMAMVTAVTAFARIFNEMGLSAATVQQKNLTGIQVNALFWLNVLAGVVLTVAMAASAPVLVWFYHEPAVFWVTMALSATFLVTNLGNQHSALLTREMRFRALAVIQVAGAGAGVVASVIAAGYGLGYWSIVVGTWVTTFVSVVLQWGYSSWRPGLPAGLGGIGALFHFGANVTGFEVANYFSRNLDNVLIGRVCGAEPLGLYSRAYSLLMLPITNLRNPLNAVAYPALSRLQGDAARFRAYYGKYVALLGFASMPLAAFLFVCSDNVIQLVLGSRWAGASSIFQILAIVGFLQPVTSTRGLVMLACGFSRRYLWLGVFNSAVTAAAFGIGVIWGPIGVAAAYVIVSYLIQWPNFHYAFKGSPIRTADFFRAIAKSGVASIAACALTLLQKYLTAGNSNLMAVSVGGTIFALSYLVVFWVLPGGRGELREYFSHLKLIVAPKLKGAASAGAPE